MNKHLKVINEKTKQPFYGERLRLIRYYYGESMAQFADRIGLTKQTISKIELGLLVPSKVTEAGICKVYNMPDDFFRSQYLTIQYSGNQLKFPLLNPIPTP